MKDTIYKDFRVVDTLRVDVTSSIYKISTGDTIDFICLSQADSYKWTPTTNLSSSNSSTTKFSTATPGVFPYTVSVTQGNCQGSTTFSIKARKAPANDKICNAIELKPGKNGPFTNINATVDAYEPSPEDTSCYKPMSWCDEGGLQNSVWFKFTAGTGKYSTIISEGMDTQLALYRADLCTQVVKDSLKAANDDFFDKDKFYAAAIQMARVVPGKTYYVQMDGSGGGVEDTFYLYLQDTPVNIENIENITNSLSIYPIPNNGNFNLSYSSET
ncbi:MAG: hypothetical protein MUD09_02305, partial [Desulfobacterales bacterium]|nr:hypothetical protein [Desulfobacterales bacterium]